MDAAASRRRPSRQRRGNHAQAERGHALAGIAPEVSAMFGLQRYGVGAAALIAIASTATLFALQPPPPRASDRDATQVIAQLERHDVRLGGSR
jgi:hypothetical protein